MKRAVLLMPALVLALVAGVCWAQPQSATGRVTIAMDRGNGLPHYRLGAGDRTLTLWIHILDPQAEEKRKALEAAAEAGTPVTVEGEPSAPERWRLLSVTPAKP